MNLETARKNLQGWIMAEQSLMTAQEYRMGTQMLRRADLSMVAERIKYWTKELAKYEGRPRNRVQRVIPRDT